MIKQVDPKDLTEESQSTLQKLIERCRQLQEVYLIEKNEEPVQLSLFEPGHPKVERR